VCLALLVLVPWLAASAIGRRQLDRHVQAIRATGDPIEVSDFAQVTLHPRDNALTAIDSAASLVSKPDLEIDPSDVGECLEVRTLYPDVVQVFVDQSRLALEVLRDGVELDTAVRTERFDAPLVTMKLFYQGGRRDLVKSLTAVARIDLEEGRQRDFVLAMRDLVLATDHMDYASSFTCIEHLVALAMRQSALGAIAEIVLDLELAECVDDDARAHLLPCRDELEQLLAAVQYEEAMWRGLYLSLCGERAMHLDTIRLFVHGPGRAVLRAKATELQTVFYVARPLVYSEGITLITEMNALIDATRARPPFGALRAVLPGDRKSGFVTRLPYGLRLRDKLMPTFDTFMYMHYNAIANSRIAAAAIAIRLYELDHGVLPTTLDDLVPRYLTALPMDPFSPGNEPVRWVHSDERVFLYHRGANGLDDNGEFTLTPTGRISRESADGPTFLRGGPQRTWQPPAVLEGSTPRDIADSANAEPMAESSNHTATISD
jgi:hypothetical protein